MFFAAFGTDHSAERSRSHAVEKEIVAPAASRHGLDVTRADRGAVPGSLTTQTFRSLLTSRVVVCDVTHASPNVFYELGVVHACNLPVVLLSEETEKLPFYIRNERIIATGSPGSASFKAAQEALDEALEIALAPTYAPGSVVGKALGLSGPFPPALRQAAYQASVPLYREQLSYELQVRDLAEDHLTMRLALSYKLVNRTEDAHRQTVGVVPMRPFSPIFGQIANRDLDTSHPDYLTERGWQVPYEFAAGSATDISFVVDVKYRMPDADVFATYLPATDFKLTVRFPHERLRVVAESHLASDVTPEEVAKGYLIYRPPGAVLAYGGFKLDWLAPRVLD